MASLAGFQHQQRHPRTLAESLETLVKDGDMLELELATTEQILDELAKRPIEFVFVSVDPWEKGQLEGYLAHSPHLGNEEALRMLQHAEQFLEEPLDEQPFDDDAN
mgnify:CR=1 FL=1